MREHVEECWWCFWLDKGLRRELSTVMFDLLIVQPFQASLPSGCAKPSWLAWWNSLLQGLHGQSQQPLHQSWGCFQEPYPFLCDLLKSFRAFWLAWRVTVMQVYAGIVLTRTRSHCYAIFHSSKSAWWCMFCKTGLCDNGSGVCMFITTMVSFSLGKSVTPSLLP